MIKPPLLTSHFNHRSTINLALNLRFNRSLRQALNTHLAAMHRAANYTFSSVADLLRHVIAQIEQGQLRLDQDVASEAEDSALTIRVSAAQKNFWQSLPPRKKRQILERAITEVISQLHPLEAKSNLS